MEAAKLHLPAKPPAAVRPGIGSATWALLKLRAARLWGDPAADRAELEKAAKQSAGQGEKLWLLGGGGHDPRQVEGGEEQ